LERVGASGMSATGHADREPLRVAPMGFRLRVPAWSAPSEWTAFRCTFLLLPSRRRRNMSARQWTWRIPPGAESLAPQPSQLASAVASTKKSLLANLRNLDGRAQPSPNAIPVARKIKKSPRRQLLVGRIVGQSDRTTMVQGEQPAGLRIRQVYWSGPSIGGGMCPLHRRRQTSKCSQILLSF
jgi:hypothetical protein